MAQLTPGVRFLLALGRYPLLYRLGRTLKNLTLRPLCNTMVGLARRLFPRRIRLGPPKGCYSILDELRSPAPPAGRIILEDQGAPVLPARSLQVLSGLRQHLEQPWPIFWSRHARARLVGPGLALVNERKEMAVESGYGIQRALTDPGYRYVPLRAPRRLPGRWTSVISRWVPSREPTIYAHWMLEALPRLAVSAEWPDDTRILVPATLSPFQQETLGWLNLKGRCRPTREQHLEVEDYFFTSMPTVIVCYSPYAVEFLRSRFLPFAQPGSIASPRFFLHRRTELRRCSNETEVLEFFREIGWAIADPAQMTVAEQIRLFSQAEAVCGLHGAGFTNLVWCPPACQVIELLADSYLNGCYEWLAYCVQARHRFLVFHADPDYNIRVDLQQLRALLRELKLA